MMKKLIAVLFVVFACFSLSADDIPMDWYIQIVKALDYFSASDFEKHSMEKLDEKTVKMSRKPIEPIENAEENTSIIDIYFRFNLTPEETKKDRLLFMKKAGELFSNGAALGQHSYDEYKEFSSYLFENIDTDTIAGYRSTTLNLTYDLKNVSSLSHFVMYEYVSLVFRLQ